MTRSVPCIGAWYRIPGEHCEFRVLTLTSGPARVRVRYADGTGGALDMIAWHAMEAERIDPPPGLRRVGSYGRVAV